MPLARGAALLLLGATLLSGCARERTGSVGKVAVVTTISTFNSFVQGVGGEYVTVRNIVPVGASPEMFSPAPQDVATVADANVVVENGAGLETWLDRLLHDAGTAHRRVVVCSAGLPVKGLNPHLWMDPVLAQRYVDTIRDALIAVDPAHAQAYRHNAASYNVRLAQLTRDIRRRIATIPPSRRYMVVFHNAWQYYNDRFGITTLGFVERNPGQAPNPQQIAQLIDVAKAHHLRAVFSEPEYSPKLLHSIAQGAGIRIVEDLYDDSVGYDPRVSNYIAMLTYDTDVIVQALK